MANHANNNVSILLGNCDGTFAAAVNYPADTASYSVTTGNFIGDGRVDLAVTNADDSNVSILLNTSSLPAAQAIPTLTEWGVILLSILLLSDDRLHPVPSSELIWWRSTYTSTRSTLR